MRIMVRAVSGSCPDHGPGRDHESTPGPECPGSGVGLERSRRERRLNEGAKTRERGSQVPESRDTLPVDGNHTKERPDWRQWGRRSQEHGPRSERPSSSVPGDDTGEGRRAPPQERNPGGRRGRPLAGALQRDADPEAVTRTAPRAARGRPADPGPDGQAEGVPRARGRVVRDVRPGRRARRDLLLPGEADLSGRQLLHDGAGRRAHRHRAARGRTRAGRTRAQPRPRMEARGPAHRLHGRPLHRRDPHRQQVGRALQVPAAHPA